jgi:hypothetical protein
MRSTVARVPAIVTVIGALPVSLGRSPVTNSVHLSSHSEVKRAENVIGSSGMPGKSAPRDGLRLGAVQTSPLAVAGLKDCVLPGRRSRLLAAAGTGMGDEGSATVENDKPSFPGQLLLGPADHVAADAVLFCQV